VLPYFLCNVHTRWRQERARGEPVLRSTATKDCPPGSQKSLYVLPRMPLTGPTTVVATFIYSVIGGADVDEFRNIDRIRSIC
jgi:hypothetical protein